MRTSFLFLWLLAAVFLAGPAHAANEMGTIISLTPSVQAERGGSKEEIQLKSPVYKADVLRSGPTGKAQILLLDDTTIAIAPGTQVRMEEFALDGGNSSFVMQLGNGLARVVTGKIVESNPDGFKVVTPHATTGIRGTDATIMDDGIKTTVISNTIHKRNILVTNRATGEVTAIAKSGMAVEASSGGNLLRPATPEERARAVQAARRDPPSLLAANSKTGGGGSGSGGSAGGSASGSGGSSGSASGTATGEGNSKTSSAFEANSPLSAGTGSVTGTSSSPQFTGSEPNLNLKGEPKLPEVVPPVLPEPPVPPTPTPDPIPPTPNPDPVPPTPVPPTPDPDPVPPTPDPDPVPPIDPPIDPPVPPIVPPVVPPVDPPISAVSGGFTGSLTGSARSGAVGGYFQMEVALATGAISKGTMEIYDSGSPLFAAYGGTGRMASNSFTIAEWGTIVGKTGSLSGTFSGNSLTRVTWDAAASDSIGWSGAGKDFASPQEEGSLSTMNPTSGISGWYSGGLTGGGDTGDFQFQVNSSTGAISDAHMRIIDDSGDYAFEAYKGTGLVIGTDFNVFNWGLLLTGKNGILSGKINSTNITNATWSAAADNNDSMGGIVDSSSHSAAPDITPETPNPNGISGGYKGALTQTGTGVGFNHGDFQFNVDLKTGLVSGASLRGFSTTGETSPLFSAYQGTGKMKAASASRGFLVQDWGVSSEGTITLSDAQFNGDKELTDINWSVFVDSSNTWSGGGKDIVNDPSGYTPLATNPASISGGYKGALGGVDENHTGAFQFNVDLGTGAVSGASMTLNLKLGGTLQHGAYGGRGSLTPNSAGFFVQTWDKTFAEADAMPKLSGSFTGTSLTNLDWKLADKQGTGLSGVSQAPSGYTPLERPAVSGHFTGVLLGKNNANTGTYDLNVDIDNGLITHAALSGEYEGSTFSAIDGTGVISGNTFTVTSFLGDTEAKLAGTLNPNASNSVQTLTGITWSTQINGATVNHGADQPSTFSPVMENKSPEHIQGTFKGTAGIDPNYAADIGFKVVLGTGALSDSTLKVYPTATPESPVFTGIGGAGGNIISPTDYGFAVTGLADGTKSGWEGQFDGKFTSADGGNIANWKVTETGTTQYSGTNMPFTKQ